MSGAALHRLSVSSLVRDGKFSERRLSTLGLKSDLDALHFFPEQHLHKSMLTPSSFNNPGTAFRLAMCSSIVFEKMVMSSKKIITNFHWIEFNLISISRCNFPGAFFSPNDIRAKRNRPWCDTNALLSRSCSSIEVCQ